MSGFSVQANLVRLKWLYSNVSTPPMALWRVSFTCVKTSFLPYLTYILVQLCPRRLCLWLGWACSYWISSNQLFLRAFCWSFLRIRDVTPHSFLLKLIWPSPIKCILLLMLQRWGFGAYRIDNGRITTWNGCHLCEWWRTNPGLPRIWILMFDFIESA